MRRVSQLSGAGWQPWFPFRCGLLLRSAAAGLGFRDVPSHTVESAVRFKETFGVPPLMEMRSRSFYPFLLLWTLFACSPAPDSDLVLVGAKIYPSPTEQTVEN